MRTLVLGLGNPLLTDDAIGLHVVRALRSRLGSRPDVEIDEDCHGGLRLMERLIGYDRGIVVDAIRSGEEPGSIHRLPEGTIPTRHSTSAHDTSLATALDLGRTAQAPLPEAGNILFIAIEAADVTTIGERCTPQVEAAVPRAVEAVLHALDEGGTRDGVP